MSPSPSRTRVRIENRVVKSAGPGHLRRSHAGQREPDRFEKGFDGLLRRASGHAQAWRFGGMPPENAGVRHQPGSVGEIAAQPGRGTVKLRRYPNTGRNYQFSLPDLFRQSIYSRLAGYEDTDDAERLAEDPTFRMLASRERRETSIALTSTLHWFETDVLTEERNYQGLARFNTDLVQHEAARPPDRARGLRGLGRPRPESDPRRPSVPRELSLEQRRPGQAGCP